MKYIKLILIIIILVPLTGCYNYRELNDLGYGFGSSILTSTGRLNAFPKHNATPGTKDFNLSIDLDENYLLRADKSSTASFYNTFLNDGVFSINEVRHQLGYGDIEGGDNHIIAYTKLESNTIENLDNENQNDLDNEDEEGNWD